MNNHSESDPIVELRAKLLVTENAYELLREEFDKLLAERNQLSAEVIRHCKTIDQLRGAK